MQIFDWLREQISDTAYCEDVGTCGYCQRTWCPHCLVDRDDLDKIINEAEAKWEADMRKHDIEVHNKAITEFEKQMKFEYRESVGTTKKERHFAEAVIEQVAHSLTEVE